jgi:hypothetical protein
MKITNDPKRIQKRIAAIQRQLAQLGPMRPGCLSRQYKEPKVKKGPYYQLSYTHRMQHKNEYIHPDLVPQIEQELAEYRRYRELNQEWIQLCIELSRLKIKQWKETANRPGQSA